MLTARIGEDKTEIQEQDRGVMSDEQAHATFDAAARRYLNISGAEFYKKWKAGAFKGKRDMASKIDAVSILLPLIER
jgi:hypothetical protein